MKIYNLKNRKMTEEQYEQAKFIKERIDVFEGYQIRIEKMYKSLKREEQLDLEELTKLLRKCYDIAKYCVDAEKQKFEKL